MSSRSEPPADLAFERVYEAHFEFVWRSLLRLGVPASMAEDAAQEVFVIVHRKLSGFEGRSSVKTWIYGIARRVAKDQRRIAERRAAEHGADPEQLASAARAADELVQDAERARVLEGLLSELDEVKRETFVLAELEGLTANEIAEVMETKPSTVYTRLSAAREAFSAAVRRYQARQARIVARKGARA